MDRLVFLNEVFNINDKKKIYNEIEKDKKYILNYYRREPAYKDKMDIMELKSRGEFYYHSLVKNQTTKKTNFVKLLLQSISKMADQAKKTVEVKRERGYNLSKLESLKNQKDKLDKKLKLRENSETNIYYDKYKEKHKTNIFLLSGKKCLENTDNNKKSIPDSINGNRIFSGIKDKTERNGSITTLKNGVSRSLSLNSIFNNIDSHKNLTIEEKRIDKFNNILDKCQKEIKDGDKIGGKMEKFTNKFNRNLSRTKKKRENKSNNVLQDQKIIEDKIKPKQKYKLLEIQKFKELKRKINMKISDNYAYFNRKEYSELINDQRKEEEYDLYYEDLNKMNENILENRVKEKDKFNEIKNLLEHSYKKKDYLKNKISNYNKNRIIQLENESKEKNNFELFVKKEEKKDINIGTLIPKLLKKKEDDNAKRKKNKRYNIPL